MQQTFQDSAFITISLDAKILHYFLVMLGHFLCKRYSRAGGDSNNSLNNSFLYLCKLAGQDLSASHLGSATTWHNYWHLRIISKIPPLLADL